MLALPEFDMKITHLPGRLNVVEYALSRVPVDGEAYEDDDNPLRVANTTVSDTSAFFVWVYHWCKFWLLGRGKWVLSKIDT